MRLSTKISESIEDWTQDQFSVLLMIHAAYADLEYSDEERKKILEFISEDALHDIESFYKERTDGQIFQLILKYKSRFLKTLEDQQLLLKKLTSVFEADGEISKLEQTQYEFMSRLIMDSQS